jgi:hypothetical protein
MVELSPKNTKKSNYDFGPFFHFFGHFTTFTARISGKHCRKVEIFAKFEFSVSDLPQQILKNPPKKAFLADFHFFNCHF